jgi:4,5-dihydroxyphthalate decarboxylase
MSNAPLTIVTRPQGNNRDLVEGRVRPDGVELEFVDVPVLVQGFRRMVRDLEFDVSEMALTTYLCAKEHGVAFTALPVFLARGFHHGALLRSAAVELHPKDLEGQRVGVNRGYTVTTGVWARGVLASAYGVDLDTITWVRSGDEHVAGYQPPGNVESAPAGADLLDLLADGDLAATVGVDSDRTDVAPLIADPDEAGYHALARTGHYPINHLVVVRDDVLDARPEVAGALFAAFAEAKTNYIERLRTIEQPTAADRMYQRVADITDDDPLPYGIEPNRHVLSELIDHALDQHILTTRPDIDALFAEPTRGLVG